MGVLSMNDDQFIKMGRQTGKTLMRAEYTEWLRELECSFEGREIYKNMKNQDRIMRKRLREKKRNLKRLQILKGKAS